jgi:glutamate/tyrosine decarboxylase-like PLP-dependent enzyme
LKSIKADDNLQMRGESLEAAIKEDIAAGLIPFYAVATLGTTNTCAFDRLDEVGPVANRFNVWLHVDAAYVSLFYSSHLFLCIFEKLSSLSRLDQHSFAPNFGT